jgi:anaerobic selenocysteine-containing dehydrogenase
MSKLITRRDFLRIGALGIGSAVLVGCQRPRRWEVLEPYVRAPEEQLTGVATYYASTCRQCPAGCGIMVRVMNGRALKIEGNPDHPLNLGRLCARGQAGLQALYNPDRLPGPVKQDLRGTSQFLPISWEEGINNLYEQIKSSGSKLAVWCDSTISGHLYDLFTRFCQAVGAPPPLVFDLFTQINGYSEFAKINQMAGGSASLPGFDISQADFLLSFGANFLGSWLSDVRFGIDYGQFRDQVSSQRGQLVQLEANMSMTGAIADEWLPIKPGTEGLVAQAITAVIAKGAIGSSERIAQAQKFAGGVDPGHAAVLSGLSLGTIEMLAQRFVTARQPVAVPGSALLGQEAGVASVLAVQALNAIVGAANTRVESTIGSLVRVSPSSFDQVTQMLNAMNNGEVQTLLLYGANPMYELPEAFEVRAALDKVAKVVSFASIVDETTAWADLVLPDRTYLESWGYEIVSPDFGNPFVGAQQPVVTPVFDARSTGDILLTVARGIQSAADSMPWEDEVTFLKESIGNLPAGFHGGDTSEVKWARFLQFGGWSAVGGATSASLRLGDVATQTLSDPVYQGEADQYPYFLKLYMNSYMSDGRGASQNWLQGSPDPMTTVAWQTWIEINPLTAKQLSLKDGDVVTVESPFGKVEAITYTYLAIRPDTVAIPLGEGHTNFGQFARLRGANAIQLVGAQTDAASGSLLWASVRVKITPTGQNIALARLENKDGPIDGFINADPPV